MQLFPTAFQELFVPTAILLPKNNETKNIFSLKIHKTNYESSFIIHQ